MNYRNKLSSAYMYNEKNVIVDILVQLANQRLYLDKWFDLFLERYGDQMDQQKNNTPLWKKYNQRFEEYVDIKNQILIAEHYSKKLGASNV